MAKARWILGALALCTALSAFADENRRGDWSRERTFDRGRNYSRFDDLVEQAETYRQQARNPGRDATPSSIGYSDDLASWAEFSSLGELSQTAYQPMEREKRATLEKIKALRRSDLNPQLIRKALDVLFETFIKDVGYELSGANLGDLENELQRYSNLVNDDLSDFYRGPSRDALLNAMDYVGDLMAARVEERICSAASPELANLASDYSLKATDRRLDPRAQSVYQRLVARLNQERDRRNPPPNVAPAACRSDVLNLSVRTGMGQLKVTQGIFVDARERTELRLRVENSNALGGAPLQVDSVFVRVLNNGGETLRARVSSSLDIYLEPRNSERRRSEVQGLSNEPRLEITASFGNGQVQSRQVIPVYVRSFFRQEDRPATPVADRLVLVGKREGSEEKFDIGSSLSLVKRGRGILIRGEVRDQYQRQMDVVGTTAKATYAEERLNLVQQPNGVLIKGVKSRTWRGPAPSQIVVTPVGGPRSAPQTIEVRVTFPRIQKHRTEWFSPEETRAILDKLVRAAYGKDGRISDPRVEREYLGWIFNGDKNKNPMDGVHNVWYAITQIHNRSNPNDQMWAVYQSFVNPVDHLEDFIHQIYQGLFDRQADGEVPRDLAQQIRNNNRGDGTNRITDVVHEKVNSEEFLEVLWDTVLANRVVNE